ncbi:MAG: GNAT family N-acetyltransferase [Alphaproteobacteria bacterium]|nr:MAG: GNAT family N-acetyltransferase [Alphaproteobacteria bacterium]
MKQTRGGVVTEPTVILGPGELVMNNLEIRLAQNQAEIDAALRLRYRVFYNEMSAKPTPEMEARGQDFDSLDEVCDHLLVLDNDRGGEVVGTYRLIRREAARKNGKFYSEAEFDISKLVAYPGEILELGRSCIDASYRTRPTMQLLWRGIAIYVGHYNIALMFGCASFHGTDVKALALPLSYLYYHHLAPPALRPVAWPHCYVDMRLMDPKDMADRQGEVSAIAALGDLPPLIKGYLRVGGFIGDGAYIDHEFNSTDVCVVVKTDMITDKYYRHYLAAGDRDGRRSGES